MTPDPLTALLPSGQRVCGACGERTDRHVDGCPVGGLEREVRELASAVGLFVADIRERLETLDRLLHGGTP